VNCYAERQALRFVRKMKKVDTDAPDGGTLVSEAGPFASFVQITNGHPSWTGKVELVHSKLTEPLRWQKPRRIFVNSMSDLFHEELSDEDILTVFQQMAKCTRHRFQVLTKRSERMREFLNKFRWRDSRRPADRGGSFVPVRFGEQTQSDARYLPHVAIGVSVEDQAHADLRIPDLLKTPAAVRFVSYEPALGPVDFTAIAPEGLMLPTGNIQAKINCLTLHDKDRLYQPPAKLDWVIVGGESGPGARSFDLQWAQSTIAQCAGEVSCFVKQLGSNPVITGRTTFEWKCQDKKGADPNEWPPSLRVREFPEALCF
jgi:protein gp37